VDQQTFQAVDDFVQSTVAAQDDVLNEALADAARAGMPAIQVSAAQGKLLQLLAQAVGARTVLEVGTLAGYSTIWLGRALPAGGRLITLEYEPLHAEVARGNLERAGLAELVDLRVGPALDSFGALAREGAGPFDLTFIDADKVNTPAYFEWALERSRPGALILADNVVRGGSLADAADPDPVTGAQRRFHEMLAADARVSATTIQTVGGKGYDGFTVALVLGR